ncbi:MAG: 16S rRNA (guanine(527)-N(7))-methyltransferase RsmG [Alphaproteobacteria bacterium]|nr:16S rRNA (guanine(527)-N(7))-methyltransferase RsmG [Alphaproteobacteria bacterium]
MKHAPETSERLAAYRSLLLRWNVRINLISGGTAAGIDQRHIADCAQLGPLLPRQGPAADIGSGAGLPGMVLAILQPDREFHLVESDKRKAAFLVEASAQLKLPMVRVHACRAENAKLPPLSVVTARALAPLASLLPYAVKFLAPDGVALFPKGKTAEKELTEAAQDWHFNPEHFPSATNPGATILRLSNIQRVQP